MKKLLLLPFTLLIMGVLFFGCEKENEVLNSGESDTYAVERNWQDFDFTNCIGDGGCPCRLINISSSGREIDLCPENYLEPQPHWSVGQGLDLENWKRVPGDPTYDCFIPGNDCDLTYTGEYVTGYWLHTTDSWDPLTDDADHYHFPHHGVIQFCFLKEGYIRVCNPEPNNSEWHLVCEGDAHPDQYVTFQLLPGQCKLFWVDSSCSVEECQERP